MAELEYLIWIFTGACNLACQHCYAWRFRGLPELGLEERLRLVDEAVEMGVEYVNLAGGEPLLHPHTPPVLERLGDHGVEKSVVTNATSVSEEVARVLARTETEVMVSIDGPRDAHDAVRGAGSFERTLRGIEVLKRHVGQVAAVFTVSPLNWRRAGETIDLLASLGIEAAAVLPAMPSGRARETGAFIGPREYLSALLEAGRRAGELGVRLSAWCTPWAPLVRGLERVGSWFCRGARGVDLDPAGGVLLCDVLDFRLSSARGAGLREAVRKARGHPLSRLVARPPRLPEACAQCPLSPLCRGGCYARAYLLRGDLNAGDPLCPRVSLGLALEERAGRYL